MEEKVLIKSAKYDASAIFKKYSIIGIVLSVITFFAIGYEFGFGIIAWRAEEWADKAHWGHASFLEEYPTQASYVFKDFFHSYFLEIIISLGVLFLFVLIGALIYFALYKSEMVVTDKRVYGVVSWGKRVDLPIDSVSATATTSLFKGVSVATSSGKISFLLIRNRYDIYKIINDLLIQRQKQKVDSSPKETSSAINDADELKKFKDLLDSGIITQEEFDAKKKQLLGL